MSFPGECTFDGDYDQALEAIFEIEEQIKSIDLTIELFKTFGKVIKECEGMDEIRKLILEIENEN